MMPAVLLTAFCTPIQRPEAVGPAKCWVSAHTAGLVSPSASPVASSSSAPVCALAPLAAMRHTPTPAALKTSALL